MNDRVRCARLLCAARTPDCDVTIERDGCGRITRESQGDAWVVDENGRPVIGDDGRQVVVERPRFDPTRPLEDPHSHRYNGNLGHTGHSEPSILRAAEADPRVMGPLETPGNRLRIVSQGSGVDRGTRTAAAHKGPRDACASCRNALQEFADDVGRRLGREGDVIVEYPGEDLMKPRQFTCH